MLHTPCLLTPGLQPEYKAKIIIMYMYHVCTFSYLQQNCTYTGTCIARGVHNLRNLLD